MITVDIPNRKVLPPQRIRRNDQMPHQMKDEAAHRHRYPHRVDLRDGYRLEYRRERFHKIDHERIYHDEEPHPMYPESRMRDFFGWIVKDGQRVGGVAITEYKIYAWEAHIFMQLMDLMSMETYTIGQVITDTWTEDALYNMLEFGSIVYYDATWVMPAHARSGIWVDAGKVMIESIGWYSMLLTKAFPLEYQSIDNRHGHDEPLPDNDNIIKHRQAAMFRYYRRHFGFKPLPNAHGEDGWLWVAHERFNDVKKHRRLYPWLSPRHRKRLASVIEAKKLQERMERDRSQFFAGRGIVFNEAPPA